MVDQGKHSDQVQVPALTTSPDAGRLPNLASCLAQLDRLVQNGAMAPETRAYALLAYLIDHYLDQGPGVPIKAYAIAVDVFGRPASFDSAQDSIVRVEIGRLRKLLAMYFSGPGRNDPTRFELPKGQSHLVVRERDGGIGDAGQPAEAIAGGGRKAQRSFRLALFTAVSVVLGAAIVFVVMFERQGTAELEAALNEDFPRVFVLPFQKDETVGTLFPNSALSAFVATELSAFKTFRVVYPLSPSTLPVRPQDYTLEGRSEAADGVTVGSVDLNLVLRDGLGTVLWSETLEFGVGIGGPEPTLGALSDIGSTLGGAMGVLDADGRARLGEQSLEWANGSTSEFQCILLWQTFDLTKGAEARAAARQCLESLAQEQTPVGQIWSALAFLRFLEWTEAGADPEDERIDAALLAANRSLLLDPMGPDGHAALGSILTGLGRIADAREALGRALDLNPSNLETAIKIAWLDALEGDWESAVGGIGSVASRYTVVPGWYRLPLALAAFRAGDPETMLSEARAIIATGDRRGIVLALIAARLAGDPAEEQKQTASLQAAGRSFSSALAEIEAVFPDPELIGNLRRYE